MGESVAPVRTVDPSDIVGNRDVVVGATDVAMGDPVSASATAVGSIEAVVEDEVVRTVGAFDPSEVGGRDAVSVCEMVVNGADDGEEDPNNTATAGDVVAVSSTRVGEVVVVV